MTIRGARGAAGRVLFIGTPSALGEVAGWAEFRQWATENGLTLTRALLDPPGAIAAAVVTDDIRAGRCTAEQSVQLARAHAAQIPCVSVHDAPTAITHRLASGIGCPRGKFAPSSAAATTGGRTL
ncbi:hypothetical protein EEB14_54545 [Rhodococcus sp. WS4]|nr:hypothetical protein EEB14_54545 [Rhodococcus sp. WS4]